MAAIADKLTWREFQLKYAQRDVTYEYWYGKAIRKSMPTWIHGLLQGILIRLLTEAGYSAAAEVELRIAADAHPKPDIIATLSSVEEPYPTKAVDVVVEILSEDDPVLYLLDKCQAYKTWGFLYIYVVDPGKRRLFHWTGSALELTDTLTSIAAGRIWEQLDQAMRRDKRQE